MQNSSHSPQSSDLETVLKIFVASFLAATGIVLICKQVYRKDKISVSSPETCVVEKNLSDWDVLQLAIMMTESEFNPEAVGTSGDWGIMQITEIYTKEVNRIQGYSKYVHEDAFDIDRSLEMFNVVQSYYNPERDVEKALKYHNRASWYANRVKKNMELIRRMERGREAILNMKKDLFMDDIGTLQNVRE